MIKNEHQYRMTRGEIQNFEHARAELEARPLEALPAVLRQARADALGRQLEDLHAEVREYEAIRDGSAHAQRHSLTDHLLGFLYERLGLLRRH